MRSTWICIALMACGGSSDGGDDDPPEEATLTLHAGGAAAAATRGDDETTWQAIALDAAGDAEVAVGSRYVVAVVCDDAGAFTYRTVYTAGDTELDLTCAAAVPPLVDIVLDGSPDVEVTIGTAHGFGGDTVQVPMGIHDVVAIDRVAATPRFVIDRAVEFTASATHPVVVDGAAPALGATTLTVAFDPTDAQELFSELTTSNGTVVRLAASFGGPVPVIPTSALADGDRLVLGATGTSFVGVRRTVARAITSDQPALALALPAAIGEVSPVWEDAAPGAAWVEDAPFEELRFEVRDPEAAVTWTTEVRAAFTRTGGIIQPVAIPDPTEIPTWDPSWNVTDPGAFDWVFTGAVEVDGDLQTSSRNGTF